MFLEEDILPKWRQLRDDSNGLNPLPQEFQEDLAAALHYMKAQQDEWEGSVASKDYDVQKDEVDKKKNKGERYRLQD